MKMFSSKLFALFIVLLGICEVYAGRPPGKGPPAPTAKAFGTSDLPPPPGLPVDENIFILFSVAILLGIYIIYRSNLKTKNPI
jgi:hypothetical protein